MKKILGLLVTAFMLTASALAADLDTPQIGAAVCAPEEADGSVVLHEAPDGRSETLMRYFQGAPLHVLDLADGWAHVRMGMEGDSLEGYIRQERLKYGAEAMRKITQYASMPGFESDVIIYQACDEQSDIVEAVQGPWRQSKSWAITANGPPFGAETALFPMTSSTTGRTNGIRFRIRFCRWTAKSPWKKPSASFAKRCAKSGRNGASRAEYDDEKLLNEEIQWDCSGVSYEPWREKPFIMCS